VHWGMAAPTIDLRPLWWFFKKKPALGSSAGGGIASTFELKAYLTDSVPQVTSVTPRGLEYVQLRSRAAWFGALVRQVPKTLSGAPLQVTDSRPRK
jgi:hypothetical protein